VRSLMVPLLIAAQMLLVHWGAGRLEFPVNPDPAGFPVVLDGWISPAANAVDPGVIEQLNADQVVDRTYWRSGFQAPVNVLVAWYRWRQEGSREPHSPHVCLPASGWVTDRSDKIRLTTTAGTIEANLLSIHNPTQQGAMVYWYQMPRRAVAGEWSAKFALIEESVRDRRTDGAFVRIFVPAARGADAIASASAESAGRALYPAMCRYLPE
jgi:EpsI family protein